MEHDEGPRLRAITDWMGAVMRYRTDHPSTVRILDTLERLLDRPYRTHVLLHGEAGTGKEGLARAIHAAMHEGGERPFVKVPSGGRDCEVLSRHLFGVEGHPGALDRAEGGTVFLDEVATMPREIQARLVPALRGRFRRDDDAEQRPCGVVVIGATDHDLARLVAAGDFRHDLFHRLARIELHVPPLRERREDIARGALWIGNRLLRSHLEGRGLALEGEQESDEVILGKDAVEVLEAHGWPGNFRELDLVMERALFLHGGGDRVGADDVRAALRPVVPRSA